MNLLKSSLVIVLGIPLLNAETAQEPLTDGAALE